MLTSHSIRQHTIALALVLCTAAIAPAAICAEPPAAPDASRSGALFDELAKLDRQLFDAAFVSCNADAINALLVDDVEFYHDKSGASMGDQVRQDFARLTKNCPRAQGVARELIAGTLQVYPMKGDYAIQMGEHRFVEKGASAGTTARFIHLWQKRDGQWRLARVLSFDHQRH